VDAHVTELAPRNKLVIKKLLIEKMGFTLPYYREKIYKFYLSKRENKSQTNTLDNLKSRAPFFNKIISDFFPKNKEVKILEIGCGCGSFAYYIKQNGYHNYTGIDSSEEQARVAKKLKIDNIIFANLVDYINNLGNESIDVLLAIDVIEHFTKEELSNLIDNFYRVLRKKGVVISHQPNGEGVFGNAIRYGDFTHELAFTRNSITQIFLSSGFSSVSSYEDKPITHGIKSRIRLFLWNYFVRQFYKFLLLVERGWVDKNTIFTQNFLVVVKK